VGRPAALLGLFALLVLYYEVAPHLWHASVWWDVAWLAFVVMPAVFGLVLLALPFHEARWLLPAGVAFAVLAGVLTYANVDVFANFARLGACTLLGWWFLGYFESVSWVVLVAAIIPIVDSFSVWRGPTKEITTHHEHVFTNVLSLAFPVPGSRGTANLGVPDLLFFALFLGAAQRFGLRVYWTWVSLLVGLGLTVAATTWFNRGLPALPGIALGFLVPNADLLWRRLRRPKGARPVSDTGDGSEGQAT